MYESFYGFSELPFELTANPKYLFLSGRQREALSILQYGLFAAKSITVLIGEAGTGKTTLIRAALESERCSHVRCVYMNNPALDRDEFVRLLALKFNLSPEAGESKAVLLEQLERLLRERRDHGETTALVIDEAQSLSVGLLEEIRLLANIETPSAKLLPLVLAGQPELSDRLEDHGPAAAAPAGDASMRARAVRCQGDRRLYCAADFDRRRRAFAGVHAGGRAADP
jgi:type II secretory pathway predicted ATPase ExeA